MSNLIILVCILIASIALTNVSQATSDRVPKGSATQAAPAQSGRVMVVNSLIPGSRITVSTTPNSRPVNYTLSKDVQYVDSAGKKIDSSAIRAGARVRLEWSSGAHSAVNRVILIQQG